MDVFGKKGRQATTWYAPGTVAVETNKALPSRGTSRSSRQLFKPPDPDGIREVLASTEIDTSAPQIEADQASRSFAIRALYTYALSRPPTAAEKLRAGSIPMDATAPEANAALLSSVVDSDAHLQWEQTA